MIKNNLLDYDFPSDLKKMNYDELDILSYQIRDFLVEKVSKTGGHLASNLGVVELSIALHKSFNSPVDKLIWDVGHQSYVHKILTGRACDFDSLRQFGGMSGFPKARESEHDIFDTGHSSTSISAACGIAAARDMRGEKYHVVPIVGDGSLTGGMIYEAFNNIGSSKSKVIVVINDNGMSISKNIGGMPKHLSKLRTSYKYAETKESVSHMLKGIPLIGDVAYEIVADAKESLKYALLKGGILFEELGFTYIGPVNGHNIESLCTAFTQAKKVSGPVVIHVHTKKGKGYRPAELNPNKFHGVGPFDINSGKTESKSGTAYSDVFGKTLNKLAEINDDIVAITAAMGTATGLGDFSKDHHNRYFDVGIAEQHAVTMAAGLAKNGMRPVVAIYSSFIQRAYDQILEDVCIQNLPVVFTMDRAGVVGADGETHHGIFDISFMSSIPNLTILTPSCGKELQQALVYALSLGTPVAIRYPRGNCSDIESPESIYENEIPNADPLKNARIKSGSDVDIHAVGTYLSKALKVAEILENKGYSTGIIKTLNVKPPELILPEEGCTLVATLEDGIAVGGYGMRVDSMFPAGIHAINFGWPDTFVEHGSVSELEKKCGLDAFSIAERICEELEKRKA